MHKKAPGQSLPIIALVIVVLFGMVALAVDVGNTYSQQREVTRAANAATVAGMEQLISTDDPSDAGVRTAIENSLVSNGVDINGSAFQMSAIYLDAGRTPLSAAGPVDSLDKACQIGDCGGSVPEGAVFIDLQVADTNETFFAQLVGQDTLPVNGQSFAGRCTPTSGVYPIGIRAEDLSGNSFRMGAESWSYSDDEVQNRVMRRLYLGDMTVAGHYDILRWMSSTPMDSQGAVQASMQGQGILSQGFTEVAFDELSQPIQDEITASGIEYPTGRNNLNIGDWIYGTVNVDMTADSTIAAELLKHQNERTMLTLPIVQNRSVHTVIGEGESAATAYTYKVVGLGKFFIGRGIDPTGATNASANGFGQNATGQYLDLVYLGAADTVPCNLTIASYSLEVQPTATPQQGEQPEDPGNGEEPNEGGENEGNSDNPGIANLTGEVSLRPRSEVTEEDNPPIQYVIIMDVSGSMTMNFDGQVTNPATGAALQCEYDPSSTLPYWSGNCGGTENPWENRLERRIGITKSAIIQVFLDGMKPTDVIALVKFSAGSHSYTNSGGVTIESIGSGSSKRYWFYANDADKSQFEQVVLNAGAASGDPYLTSGGTPGATAMQRASQLLDGTDGVNDFGTRDTVPAFYPNGQPLPFEWQRYIGRDYIKAVVFLTDGVANYYLEPINGQWYNNYSDTCTTGSGNDPTCHIGILQKNGNEVVLPITAMIQQSQALQQQHDAKVYSVGLGLVSDKGLIDTASAGQYYKARSNEDVIPVFSAINDNIQNGCYPEADTDYTTALSAENLPELEGDFAGYADPVNGIMGYIYLFDEFGDPLSTGQDVVPIKIGSMVLQCIWLKTCRPAPTK
ncbi:MAG: hypothetical protein HC837_12090 [Chloroflexaceae bacterium]|nr:hypothetical protein [Chloroflexaceae bacterium]